VVGVRLRAGIGSIVIAGCLCACSSPEAATATPSTRTVAVEVQHVVRLGNATLKSDAKSNAPSEISVSVPPGPPHPVPSLAAQGATLRVMADQLSALRYPASIESAATAVVNSMRALAVANQQFQDAPVGASSVAPMRDNLNGTLTAESDLLRLLQKLNLPPSLANNSAAI
jgi:hypothetical protein